MTLVLFHSALYLLMALQLRTAHSLLPALLLLVGLLAQLIAAILPEGRFQIGVIRVMTLLQLASGLILLLFQHPLLRAAYLPMAAEHLLMGISSLFIPAILSSDREKHTLKTES